MKKNSIISAKAERHCCVENNASSRAKNIRGMTAHWSIISMQQCHAGMTLNTNRAIYAACLLLLFFSHPIFALPEDSKEKMIIQADYSTYNFKTGLSTYKGHVLVDQGSTHLTADFLTTKSHHRQIQEATAYGQKQLAHYWTLPKPNDAIIDAHAEVIHFYPSRSLVRLEKNVLIQQGENRLQGQIVLYDTKNQTVTAPSLKNTQAVLEYQSNSGENH